MLTRSKVAVSSAKLSLQVAEPAADFVEKSFAFVTKSVELTNAGPDTSCIEMICELLKPTKDLFAFVLPPFVNMIVGSGLNVVGLLLEAYGKRGRQPSMNDFDLNNAIHSGFRRMDVKLSQLAVDVRSLREDVDQIKTMVTELYQRMRLNHDAMDKIDANYAMYLAKLAAIQDHQSHGGFQDATDVAHYVHTKYEHLTYGPFTPQILEDNLYSILLLSDRRTVRKLYDRIVASRFKLYVMTLASQIARRGSVDAMAVQMTQLLHEHLHGYDLVAQRLFLYSRIEEHLRLDLELASHV